MGASDVTLLECALLGMIVGLVVLAVAQHLEHRRETRAASAREYALLLKLGVSVKDPEKAPEPPPARVEQRLRMPYE